MKKKITLIATALVLSTCFALPIATLAQDGSLDLSFDNDGIVTTPIGPSSDLGYSVAIQSDGKLVVAGNSSNGASDEFSVVRYNANGSLDITFDNDGIVTTPIGTTADWGKSVAIQSDGKIVVAGTSINSSGAFEFALVRYNTNGSLDITFDTDGILTTSIGPGNDAAYAMAIQSDGKILVTGYSSFSAYIAFGLVRYNTDGSLDTTFDTDGKVATPVGSSEDIAYSVTVQNDGKIVVAGVSYAGIINHDFAVVRYNTNGSPDTSFDTDGIVTTAVGATDDYGYFAAIQSDGKIVVSGVSYNGPTQNFAVVRYNSNGSLDTTFDGDGKVTTTIGTTQSVGFSAAIQGDGKIVVAGRTGNVWSNDIFALARYNTNGSLDTTFDTDGIVTTPIGASDDYGYSVAIQSDDKIVVAGWSLNSSNNYDFAIARYNNTIITGINETDNQTTEISIYPNPATDHLTIAFASSSKKVELTITNITGKIIYTTTARETQMLEVNTKDFAPGVYIAQILREESFGQAGDFIETKKLIVSK